MIGVLVVDDQQLVRAGISRILELAEEVDVVGECADGSEVLDAVDRLSPDVVLMDVRMKDVNGAEATRQLRERADAPPVLILTTFDDDETVAAALSAGAAGFILKDAPGEDLVRAIREVADGGAWLDPAIVGRVLQTYRTVAAPRAARAAQLEELTPRERDVLRLVGRGLANHEIAERLYITEATVKTHLNHVLGKLGLRDRAAAIVLAFDYGLVEPGGES